MIQLPQTQPLAYDLARRTFRMSAPAFAMGRYVLFGLAALLLAALPCSALVLQGQFTAHDPSRIIKCNGRYYVYATGANIQMRWSDDLVHWSNGQSVLAASDSVNGVPQWARDASPGNTGNVVWAPDILYFNGLYHLYWSFSTWGTSDSVIGLHTSPTLDPRDPSYKWTDRGPVIASKAADWGKVPNCIDPAPVYDAGGNLWLVYGSYGYGIGITRLDNATGLRLSPASTIHRLAGVNIEAAYIIYRDGFYYLFLNKGTCCQGSNSTYHIVMGRSISITGPYLDKAGRNMLNGGQDGGGSLFFGTAGNRIGPGHMGLFAEGSIDRFTYHLESDGANYGLSTLNVQTLLWGADGWPVAGSDLAAGTYRIVAKASGLTMGIRGSSTTDGAALGQDAYTGSGFQHWVVAPTTGGTPQTGQDGYYRMTSVGSGKVVDLFQCNPANGTPIVQYPWFNNDCQRWLIEQTSDGYHRIVSKGGGGVINVPGGTGDTGAALNEWAWDGSDGQKWTFVPVGAPPAISVGDAAADEGDDGQAELAFTVSLSHSSPQPVTVQYRTADDSASVADGDYTAVPLTTLTIPPNTLNAIVSVAVNGDECYEWDEQVTVVLQDPAGATLGDARGAGTIRNDDPLPTVSLDDVAQKEGDTGATAFAFTVTRTGETALPVTLFYGTGDGSATASDGDYASVSFGTVTIPPDEPAGTITVQVSGDTREEADEVFTVDLFSPSEAVIEREKATGTILNDDFAPFTLADAVAALGGAAGLSVPEPAGLDRLNVADPATPLLDLLDAVRLARIASGLEPDPR